MYFILFFFLLYNISITFFFFFFSSRRRHTRSLRDWSSDVCFRSLSNDLGRIAPGKAQYTLCCDPSGGVVDDLIAYLVADDEVFLVPNAANTAEVVRRLAEAAPDGIAVTGQHRQFGVLAVQGPRSAQVLTDLGLPADLDYMAYVDASYEGRPVRICRTGYTGEHGYELIPRSEEHTSELQSR